MGRRKNKAKGNVILESLFGMVFLLFLFFCLIQLFVMIHRQIIVDYASFYGSKATALGYADENCRKAVRVAAMSASGKDCSSRFRVPLLGGSRDRLREQAARYMTQGAGSGVDYEYWNSSSRERSGLHFRFGVRSDWSSAEVELRDPQPLFPALPKLMSVQELPSPNGKSRMFNYSRQWLDE